jgi:HAD superfamily hydrolase (TIGR01484 family)
MCAPYVYSDVDGTLLDAASRLACASALHDVAARAHLVLVSSRTLDELSALTLQWGIRADLIAENGAWMAWTNPQGASVQESIEGESWWVRQVGEDRAAVARLLRATCPSDAALPVVADEWPAAEWRRATGHSAAEALRVQRRRGSVLLDSASPQQLTAWRAAGLEAEPGGRWICVTRGAGKGKAVRLHATLAGNPPVTIGVGDAANDRSLLSAVSRPLIVRRVDGGVDPALLDLVPPALVLEAFGPAAWAEVPGFLPDRR